jgi:ZIP family zinc transporter
VIASAVAAAAGYAFVKAFPGADGRYARAFAAGAVLTMLADVMMPEAFEHGGKVVGLLATLGFLTAAVLSVME